MQNISKVQREVLNSKGQVAKKMCKTVLNAYNLLPYITSSIDRLVAKKAESSMCLAVGKSVESYANEMIFLTEQKVSLINLKVIIDETLSEMKEKEARILLLRYVDNVKCEDCLSILNMDKRTFFRRLPIALNSFYKIFNFKLWQRKLASKGIMGQMNNVFIKVRKFADNGGNIAKNKENICGLILNNLRKMV